MSTEAEDINRRIAATVRDALDVYRIQAGARPVSEHVLTEIFPARRMAWGEALAPLHDGATRRAPAEPGAQCWWRLFSTRWWAPTARGTRTRKEYDRYWEVRPAPPRARGANEPEL